ncbi:MAG TPA: LysM domain-containing protein [Thermoleophilaceae bacterium]|nr:LysM domain-containing protein [Thermoleophilaceae bacterium]
MDGRRSSPARLLAPIALVTFAFALFIVIANSDTPDDSDDGGNRAAQQQTTEPDPLADDTEPRVPDRFYTVQTGDTLAAIAERVGLTVTELQELNPELDPQALVSGQKIRLRE